MKILIFDSEAFEAMEEVSRREESSQQRTETDH